MVTWRTVLLVNIIVIAGLALIYFGVGHGPRQDWLGCERLYAGATTSQDTVVIDRTIAPSTQRRANAAEPAVTCGALRRFHLARAAGQRSPRP